MTKKTRLELLNQIQEEAVDALAAADFNGTVLMYTGSGKSIMKQKTIYKALELGKIKKGDTIWLMAEEVQARKRTFFDTEIPFFISLYNKDVTKDFDFQFHSYQSGKKLLKQIKDGKIGKPKLICLDEVETVFSPTRLCIFELQDEGTMFCGFTATEAALLNVYRDKVERVAGSHKLDLRQSDYDTKHKKITDFVNKGQCFDVFIPVVYEKDYEYGIKNGLLSNFTTTIIEHELGTKDKSYLISKKNGWYGSEAEWHKFYKQLAFNVKVEAGFRASILKQKIPQFLYKLGSKIHVGKKILECLPDNAKTLIFGKELNFLSKITPNVARDFHLIDGKEVYDLKQYKIDNGLCKYTRIGEKVTTSPLLDKFDSGEINVLASAQRLQRGVTLKGLNTLVIFISGKQSHILLQSLGRLIRFQEGKIGHLILVVTKGTFEENWLKQSCQIKNYKNEIIKTIDLNVKQIISSKSLWLTNFKL